MPGSPSVPIFDISIPASRNEFPSAVMITICMCAFNLQFASALINLSLSDPVFYLLVPVDKLRSAGYPRQLGSNNLH